MLALAAAAVCVALLVAQAIFGWEVLHSTGFFTALAARKYVWANALAAVLVAIFAAARGRWRWLAILGPGAFLLAVLLATATAGGQLWAMLFALLTMAALWDTGERLLRRLGALALSRIALVAWLAGIGPWSLGFVLLGRLSLMRWWSAGVVLLIVGTVGAVRLATRVRAQRDVIARELSATALNAASAGLLLLACAWAAIYSAAPEIQYDALSFKAFLPELWARTGHIDAMTQHVQASITGWFQVLATAGHLFGATAVGRYLQLLGLICTAVAVWWWGRRHGALGPLAAVAVALTPHLLWQASTADDDLLLALCALALCVAVVESLRSDHRDSRGLAFALGLMAGCGPSLKLHLIPLFALLMLGWIVAGRSSGTFKQRLGFASLGATVTSLPPLLLRWVETENPVLPAYNNIFHSKYWLPVNEQLNFPFWLHPGAWGPLAAVWKAVTEPNLMVEDAPPGAFGMLIGITVLALLLGWLGRDRSRANRVVWIALVGAAVFWWVNLRYLRYLLPTDFVAFALLLMLTAGVSLGRRSRSLGLLAVTLTAIASFPVTIAQFWNVPAHKPPVYAAVGHWKASSYEEAASPDRNALLAFNRLAPRDARVATPAVAFQRVWLKPERDIYNLNYEVTPLMEIDGPVPQPTNGDEALRDLRRLGIGWVLVTEADRLQNEPGYLSQVITTHGKPEFDARGWDLYRLVARPPRPAPLGRCDARHEVVSSCWGVAETRALTVSVTRTVAACAGETLAVSITQQGGPPSPVLVQFAGGNPAVGTQPGGTLAGTTQTIYATAPRGAQSANVIISPTPGARITAASIGRFGPACGSTSRAS